MNLLRKLWAVLVVTLAMNFVALAVAAAMLWQRAGLDKEKFAEIRSILFPAEEGEGDSGAADADEPAEPSPMEQLLALLDAQSGKPADRRIDDIAISIDERTVSLERRRREVADRMQQVNTAAANLAADRKAFEKERAAWNEQVAAARERATDAGFQKSLEMFESIPAKSAKTLFMNMSDEEAVDFLRAMEPRASIKVLKEFKTPDELGRLGNYLALIRQGEPTALDETLATMTAAE
jgi:hypothetical protein